MSLRRSDHNSDWKKPRKNTVKNSPGFVSRCPAAVPLDNRSRRRLWKVSNGEGQRLSARDLHVNKTGAPRLSKVFGEMRDQTVRSRKDAVKRRWRCTAKTFGGGGGLGAQAKLNTARKRKSPKVWLSRRWGAKLERSRWQLRGTPVQEQACCCLPTFFIFVGFFFWGGGLIISPYRLTDSERTNLSNEDLPDSPE